MINPALKRDVMVAVAMERFGVDIKPVDGRALLDDCFTIIDGKLQFWFNDSDGSTHLIPESEIPS